MYNNIYVNIIHTHTHIYIYIVYNIYNWCNRNLCTSEHEVISYEKIKQNIK